MTTGSVAGEIVAVLQIVLGRAEMCTARLAMPDYPEGTSFAMTKDYHVRAEHVASKVGQMLGRTLDTELWLLRGNIHDVPGDWFSGPF